MEFFVFGLNSFMPRFLAPIYVDQEIVSGNETVSGSETIFGVTSGKASYWDSVSVLSGLSAKSGSFVNSVSASSFYGDGIHLTNVRDTTKLPLSGGEITGTLTGVDIYVTNSVYSPHISGGIVYGDGSLLTGVAKLFSPNFQGIPTAPTAAAQTNTTQIATTEFVIANRGDKYLTTSSTSLALANNATYSLTAGTGLSYTTSMPISLIYDSTHYMTAVVLTYNSSTGDMTINSTNRTGTGTFSAWTINAGAVPVAGGLIAGNNLSDVASTTASLINLGGFPRTGGTLTGGLTATVGKFQDILFIPSASSPSYEQGKLFYDSVADSICYYNLTTNNRVHVGQEVQQQVKNSTSSTIPKGSPVYITGAFGEYAGVASAKADALSTSIVVGVTNQDLLSGQIGFVVTAGTITDIDTSLFSAGNDMYLSPLTAGKTTSVLPTFPNIAIQVGVCLYSHPTNGKMVVQNSYIGTLANTIVGTIGIAQGGTGQTNAAASLCALGGFPISGGNITDGLTANSGTFITYLSSPSISGVHYGDGSNLTGIPRNTDIQTFAVTGTFTWTKPTGAKSVNITCIGGGGGGGSGRRTLSGLSAAYGGGGGAGGGYTNRTIDASLLSSTEIVIVGAGGLGGASQTVDNTDGRNGAIGGNSSFGSWVFANAGTFAGQGTSSAGLGGSGASGRAMLIGGSGGNSSVTGTAGGGNNTQAGGAGGGSGGGVSLTPTAYNGGAGAIALATYSTGGSSTAGVVPGGNGNSGFGASPNWPLAGGGGAGGAGSTTTAAGSGGAGAIYGGGGGGGGGSLNGFNSGAGGPGAQGIVIVTTYF